MKSCFAVLYEALLGGCVVGLYGSIDGHVWTMMCGVVRNCLCAVVKRLIWTSFAVSRACAFRRPLLVSGGEQVLANKTEFL